MPVSLHNFCRSVCVAMIMLPHTLPAQPVDTAAVQQPGFCRRARPLPRCRVFPITEVSYLVPLASSRTDPVPPYNYGDYRDVKPRMAMSIGAMRNESLTRAQGIVVTLGFDDDWIPAIEWRNRVWLGATRSSADFGVGYTQKNVFIRPPDAGATARNVMAHGVTATAALLPIDLLGVFARGDLLFTPGRSHYGLSVGAQAGSFGAAIVTGAAAAFIVIVIAAFLGAGGY